MRKLASIQKISKILPIPEADRIELVKVLGWQCVSKKNEFKENELIVYFEIDSFLPIRDEFEFLRSNSYKKNDFMGEGFKLKTQKFRGEISQGLCLPINTFPELSKMTLNEGDDVTKILNIKEWEMPAVTGSLGTMINNRPGFIPKTDETRIQSIPSLFDEFKGLPYYITTKCDGTSCSVGLYDEQIRYSSHNYELADDDKSTFVQYVKRNRIDKNIKDYVSKNNIESLVLQGEWCGEGIQKNRMKLKEPKWFVFTAIINGKRRSMGSLIDLSEMIGFDIVPIEEKGNDITERYPDINTLLERADGNGINGIRREGIVIRPQEPVYSKILNGPLSIKVLNNKYLMKNEN